MLADMITQESEPATELHLASKTGAAIQDGSSCLLTLEDFSEEAIAISFREH